MITREEYLDIYDIVGVAMEVYNTLGYGMAEPIYQEAFAMEMKAVDKILSEHRAQLFNYMRIAQQKKGVLLNFGEKSLRAERYIFEKSEERFILLTQNNYKRYILPDGK